MGPPAAVRAPLHIRPARDDLASLPSSIVDGPIAGILQCGASSADAAARQVSLEEGRRWKQRLPSP